MYLRTYAPDKMVQAVSSSSRLRSIKRVKQFLQELKFFFSIMYTVMNKRFLYYHCLLSHEYVELGMVTVYYNLPLV
ncbi:hypothetical protein HanIR_Chr12g0604301 [Helianthus annuus]|nr:hypothetical protein HanIR_Chr12g0604301 [Helianthus annuus]